MKVSSKNWLKEEVATDDAPAAIGPYNQAVCAGPLVFISGQIGLIPGKRELAGPTVNEQMVQVLENIAAILDASCSSLDQVVKTTIYLTDMGDFPVVNEIYARYFTGTFPARATVQVSKLPLGGLVAIDAISIRD